MSSDNGTSFFVAIPMKDKDSKIVHKHYEVPKEVYVYIQQLEIYISNPSQSKIEEAGLLKHIKK